MSPFGMIYSNFKGVYFETENGSWFFKNIFLFLPPTYTVPRFVRTTSSLPFHSPSFWPLQHSCTGWVPSLSLSSYRPDKLPPCPCTLPPFGHSSTGWVPSLSLFSYRPGKLPMLLWVLSTLSLSQFGPCQYLSPFLSPVHFNHTGNTGICSLSLLLTQSSIPFLDKFLFTDSSGLPRQGKLPSLLPANWAEMMTKLMMVILSKCRPNSQRQMYLKIDRGSLPFSLTHSLSH